MLFESARLYTRLFTMDDLDAYFRIIGDIEVMRFIRAPKSKDETKQFLSELIQKYNSPVLDYRYAIVEKSSETLIGNFAIIPIPETTGTQLGYAFIPSGWGKGYATEITLAGLEYIKNNLSLEAVGAIAEEENKASVQVLIKCGFTNKRFYMESGKRVVEMERILKLEGHLE